MTQLKRNKKITCKPIDKNIYQVLDNDDNMLLSEDDDYFIYFKNVNFKKNGLINGRYLGFATDRLIDGYCRDVFYDDGYYIQEEKKVEIKTARLVAINNKNRVIIVIQN